MLNALAGISALVALAVAAFFFARHVVAGWYCFLCACAVNAYVGSNATGIAGFHLDPSDLVGIVLLLAGGLRFLRRAALPGNMRIVSVAFLAVFAFSLVRGIAANGIPAAGVDARGYMTELLAMLFFFTVPTDDATLRKFVRAYLWYGASLILAAALHYAGLPIGDAAASFDSESRDRALTVAGAASLAVCLFLTAAENPRHRSLFQRLAPPVCAGFVLILQHRTAWAILFLCVAASFLVDLANAKRLTSALCMAGLLACPFAIALYGSSSNASATFEASATNLTTWEYRVEQWGAFLFEPGQTPMEALFGAPLGTPYLHLVGANAAYDNIGPHSEYVALYTRVGAVGAILFIAFMFYPLPRLFHNPRSDSPQRFPTNSAWFLIVLCNVIYGVAYKLDPSIGALLGVANALVLHSVKLPSHPTQPLASGVADSCLSPV